MAGGEPKLLSVKDAADILELSEPGIKQMIYRDESKAEKPAISGSFEIGIWQL